jgi:hypothetical protein
MVWLPTAEAEVEEVLALGGERVRRWTGGVGWGREMSYVGEGRRRNGQSDLPGPKDC